MLKFSKQDKKHIGKAEVIDIVAVENGQIQSHARSGFKPWFLVSISFHSNELEILIDEVPTGRLDCPYINTTDEIIITDGECEWEVVRHLTPEDLVNIQSESDEHLYVLPEILTPHRMTKLTILDRDHIINKIKTYVDNLNTQLDNNIW